LLDRLVKALLRLAHRAKNNVAQRVTRIEVDGLLAFLGSLFVVTLQAQGSRPVPQSTLTGLGPLLLPQRVRLAVLLDGLVKALLRRAHRAKSVVGVWEFRIEVFGLLALFGSLFVVLLPITTERAYGPWTPSAATTSPLVGIARSPRQSAPAPRAPRQKTCSPAGHADRGRWPLGISRQPVHAAFACSGRPPSGTERT